MTGADRAERERRLNELARGCAEYLTSQTDIQIVDPDGAAAGGSDLLLVAFERLDAALAQLADLAGVYADDPRLTLEPLAVPVAALAGEYLRSALDATWLAPDGDPVPGDDAFLIVMPDGIAIDLTGIVRAALLRGAPNLTAVAARLANPNPR